MDQAQYDPRQLHGAVGQASGAPKPLPIIDNATDRVSNITARLVSLIGAVKEFNDVTRGMEPPVPANPQPPSQPGSLPRGEVLLVKLDLLDGVVQQLFNQINRLSGI